MVHRIKKRTRAVALLLIGVGVPALAGDVSGTVLAPGGEPAVDARVVLIELKRSLFVGQDGTFRFRDVPPGNYHIEAVSKGFGSTVHEIEVGAQELRLDLQLSVSMHRERIVVTATRGGRGSGEAVQPVNVLDEAALNERMEPTVGETLANEPGVSSSYFGPGSSRPIIRGQGGGRVRVLESGLGTGDASTVSPDHAVSTDMLTADQVEILRGPSTLLYGNTAVGGVVNVLDQRIPEYAPSKPISGTVNLRYADAAEEKSTSARLHGGAEHFAWYLDGFTRTTEDYAIPGRAVVDDPDSASGSLPNSDIETDGATLGLSWVSDTGFVGVSYRMLDSDYGIPAELEEAPPPVLGVMEQEGVRIDMEQRRFDLRGGFDTRLGPFNGVRFSFGATDYEHAELEGEEVGTRFFNDSHEARLELTHGESGPASGVIGVQYAKQDAEAVGLEAFLPPSVTDLAAVFAFEQIKSGSMRYEIGLRAETTDVSSSETAATDPGCLDPRDRDFTTVSGSFGVAWLPNDKYTLGGTVSRAVRPPGAEELYSCGEHVATLSVERGDPNLDEETNLGVRSSVCANGGDA